VCGDGILATSEECDLGTNNGKTGYCCSVSCKFVTNGTLCRDIAGPCDSKCFLDLKMLMLVVPETCNGKAALCPTDSVVPSSTLICQQAPTICYNDVYCNGVSTSCPANPAKPNGTTCDDGNECTQIDTCQGGKCVGTGACVCGDGIVQKTAGEQCGILEIQTNW
jgi:hypothetical protein